MIASTLVARAEALLESPEGFFDRLKHRMMDGVRLVTLWGRAEGAGDVILTAVLEAHHRLEALRTRLPRKQGFHSLTPLHPALHIFEREIFEECQLEPKGHPWLKPVRFSGAHRGRTNEYPFFRVEGKEVHEVGVGPIHAGVIEPGHFRFMCLGERVHHLEIQLGYQHRGVEALLRGKDPRRLLPLIETVAGDTSVGHAWASCDAVEGLCGFSVPAAVEVSRGIGLELERIAMHLAGLAGISQDIAFLPGASTYGRLRTTAINTSMLLCGSRFGRGWLRPGGARALMDTASAETVRANLRLLTTDLATINRHFCEARTVRHRLQGIGAVSGARAAELGFVGMAARTCGVPLDSRAGLPSPVYAQHPIEVVTETTGDCWARALLRIREIDASLRWITEVLGQYDTLASSSPRLPDPAPDSLAVAVREGWRGEVVHCVETDHEGRVRHYRIQDPSLRNWLALALAVRENQISDFPICNKSFDLSYCGNDL